MIGRKPRLDRHDAPQAPGGIRLEAAGLQLHDALGVMRLQGVSLQLRAGEIVGLAGVSGNGQSELLELLSGLRAPDSGTLRIGDARFHAAHQSRNGYFAHNSACTLVADSAARFADAMPSSGMCT